MPGLPRRGSGTRRGRGRGEIFPDWSFGAGAGIRKRRSGRGRELHPRPAPLPSWLPNHASSLTSGNPIHIACFARRETRRRWRRSRPRQSVRTAAARLLVADFYNLWPPASTSFHGARHPGVGTGDADLSGGADRALVPCKQRAPSRVSPAWVARHGYWLTGTGRHTRGTAAHQWTRASWPRLQVVQAR